MSGLLMRRRTMMQSAGTEPPAMYITSLSSDFVTLPISLPQATVKKTVIAAECYLNPSAGSYYEYSSHQGEKNGRPFLCSVGGGGKAVYYWTGNKMADPNLWRKVKSYTVDYPNSSFTITAVSDVSATASWAGDASDTASNCSNQYDMRIRISTNAYWHSVTCTVDGVVTHRLVAKYDTNGVACMYDEITNSYYYAANNTAVLVEQPY